MPWDGARRFGPVERFDPLPPPPRAHADVGVLYTATTQVTCLAEVFQATRVLDRTHLRPTATSWLTTRDLTLAHLQGRAALRLGAAESINGTTRGSRTQAWARAVVDALPAVDGFWHRSSMDDGDCVCLVVVQQADATTARPAHPDFSWPLDEVAMGDAAAQAAELVGYHVV